MCSRSVPVRLFAALGLAVVGVCLADTASAQPLKRAANTPSIITQRLAKQRGDGNDQSKHAAPPDFKRDSEQLRTAAQRGSAAAQFMLASAYYTGAGVAQSYVKAAHWYKKAAAQGYAQAQLRLGVMYGLGIGVRADSVQSAMWLLLAKANGANKAVGLLDIARITMTDAEYAKGKQLAANKNAETAEPSK